MITLSVFFSYDKVYYAVLERNRKGLHLLDIGSTLDPVNLDDINSDISQKAISQLNRSLKEIEFKIEELSLFQKMLALEKLGKFSGYSGGMHTIRKTTNDLLHLNRIVKRDESSRLVKQTFNLIHNLYEAN